MNKKEKKNMYDTWYSQAVTHPSTDQARRCLTSVIGREPVLSTWCGHTQCMFGTKSIKAIKLYLSFILSPLTVIMSISSLRIKQNLIEFKKHKTRGV